MNKSIKSDIPLLYKSVIVTGLVAFPDMPSMENVGDNFLLPPFSADMPAMDKDEITTVIIQYIAVFLHNATCGKDYPSDNKLMKLFSRAEKRLSVLERKQNPWLSIMLDGGEKETFPDFENIQYSLSPIESAAFMLARPEWDETMSSVIKTFVDWFVNNRLAVEKWQAGRLALFDQDAA